MNKGNLLDLQSKSEYSWASGRTDERGVINDECKIQFAGTLFNLVFECFLLISSFNVDGHLRYKSSVLQEPGRAFVGLEICSPLTSSKISPERISSCWYKLLANTRHS